MNQNEEIRNLKNRMSMLEGRVSNIELEAMSNMYGLEQVKQSLIKVAKRDFSYEDKNERDSLILAAYMVGAMSAKELACKFDLSTSRINQIIGK